MVIRGSYMFEFNVSKDMKEKNNIIREVAVGKVAAHFMSNNNCQGIEKQC